MPPYTALITLLTVALYFSFALRVAIARGKFGVALPATVGNPDFERIFRIHQNTTLPAVWLTILALTIEILAVPE